MVGDLDRVPPESLGAIAYLARSANRVEILSALVDGAHDRRALAERTEVAPTTLGRIVNELEGHAWIERRADGTYVATPRGGIVIETFAPMIETMDAILTLDEAVDWLPLDELPVEIRDFRDARIVRSSANAPIEAVGHLADHIRAAETFRALTFLAPPSPAAEAIGQCVVDGDLSVEFVLAGGLVEFLLSEADRPPDWRACIDAGARLYRTEERIPCHLFASNESVFVLGERPTGPTAMLVSDDEAVLSAVDEMIDGYRNRAERVDAAQFE